MTIRPLVLSAAVIALVLSCMPGCSDDSAASQAAAGNCPSVGSTECTNDEPTTQKQYDSCKTLQSDSKCGGKYTDLLKCEGANISCDSDGKSESTTACSSQSSAYSACTAGQ